MANESKPYLARLRPELHADLKAAASLEGRSMNAVLEDALADYFAVRTSGSTPMAVKSLAASTSPYTSPTVTYRGLVESGNSHEDIIRKLGGSPEKEKDRE